MTADGCCLPLRNTLSWHVTGPLFRVYATAGATVCLPLDRRQRLTGKLEITVTDTAFAPLSLGIACMHSGLPPAHQEVTRIKGQMLG
jgi:hypothetical protein